MCREKRMIVVVEGCWPYCWSCGVLGHMTKACTRRSVTQTWQTMTPAQTTPSQVGTTAAAVSATEKAPPWKLEGGAEGMKDNKLTLSSVKCHNQNNHNHHCRSVLRRCSSNRNHCNKNKRSNNRRTKNNSSPRSSNCSNLKQRWKWRKCFHPTCHLWRGPWRKRKRLNQ